MSKRRNDNNKSNNEVFEETFEDELIDEVSEVVTDEERIELLQARIAELEKNNEKESVGNKVKGFLKKHGWKIAAGTAAVAGAVVAFAAGKASGITEMYGLDALPDYGDDYDDEDEDDDDDLEIVDVESE